jgi:hypothetical protein
MVFTELVIVPCTAFEDGEDSSAEPELPEWLVEVPEDLDVCIAQRHFEEAYNLLQRAREFLDKNTATDPVITDIRYAINIMWFLWCPVFGCRTLNVVTGEILQTM